jgi:hypothetical protein
MDMEMNVCLACLTGLLDGTKALCDLGNISQILGVIVIIVDKLICSTATVLYILAAMWS